MLITGASGVGKTTLINLLLGFLRPSAGGIYLDEQSTQILPKLYLRRQIALVSQDTFLFSDSVLNNIRLGDRSISEEKVYEAARLANALEFIQNLPEGFATQVGERGARLSGGQRQRIAIARAFVRNAPILVLDEATSAVDVEAEAAIHESVCNLMKGRTSLIISHHPAAFRKFVTRWFVLQDGWLRTPSVPSLSELSPDFLRDPIISVEEGVNSSGRSFHADIG